MICVYSPGCCPCVALSNQAHPVSNMPAPAMMAKRNNLRSAEFRRDLAIESHISLTHFIAQLELDKIE